ncbi:hypothetical protein [Sphingobacterium sp. UBA5996]|uniref:hypothetical protein n=1 Tax=Sphingobacterium sp. UBA5996 TaxID=1947505 RepID=UPI0025D78F5D|nr:hypothetical protein [Sphingobacterium sp. UBA5996]
MAKSSSSKIKIMIGSTVYGFHDQLATICDVIESYGYGAIEDFPLGNYNVDDYDVDTYSWHERAGEDDDF